MSAENKLSRLSRNKIILSTIGLLTLAISACDPQIPQSVFDAAPTADPAIKDQSSQNTSGGTCADYYLAKGELILRNGDKLIECPADTNNNNVKITPFEATGSRNIMLYHALSTKKDPESLAIASKDCATGKNENKQYDIMLGGKDNFKEMYYINRALTNIFPRDPSNPPVIPNPNPPVALYVQFNSPDTEFDIQKYTQASNDCSTNPESNQHYELPILNNPNTTKTIYCIDGKITDIYPTDPYHQNVIPNPNPPITTLVPGGPVTP
jgi:hypothetical protein